MSDVQEEICPPVSRVDIAWTCVATNDPHPLHLDHEFAQRAGFPDVVVPGTMLVGWVGEYLETLARGPENLLEWSLRFTAPVWPGDQISLNGRMSEDAQQRDQATVSWHVIATTQAGRVVARASARTARPI